MSGAMNVRQKLLKGRALIRHVNVAPTVTITAFDSLVTLNVPQKGFTVVATDSEQGDVSNQVVWTGYIGVTSGYQLVSFGRKVTLSDTTGLINFGSPIPGSPVGSPVGSPYPGTGSPLVYPGSPVGSPTGVYRATVSVDGGSAQSIRIVGADAQTIGNLITELNNDTTGAVWSLSNGVIKCTSSSTGGSPSSSIAITDVNLFSSLHISGYGSPVGSPISFSPVGSPTGTFAGSPALATINSAVAGTTTTGKIGAGATPTLTFTTIGTQSVTATFTDSYGVSTSDTVVIEVAGSPVGSPAP